MADAWVLVDEPAPQVRRLTLNRPEKRNALRNELRSELFARIGFANRAYPAEDLDAAVLEVATRVTKIPTELQQPNKRSVHRAMEIMGMRAALRAGTEIQALGFHTRSTKDSPSRWC